MQFDQLKRREFMTLLGGTAVAWPFAARAQQPAMPVIGFLSGRFPNDSTANVTAFHRGLGEVGFFEGQNVEIDFRWAFGHYDQLSVLAADLIRRKVTLIVATGGGITSAQAAKAATATIPIVFVAGTDPVASGLVTSLNSPGGNLTGVSFLIGALTAKKLELLHELLPKVMTIGVLVHPNFPDADIQLRDAQAAAQALRVRLIVVRASSDGELEAALTTVVQQGAGGLAITANPLFNASAERLAALATLHAVPTIHPVREYVIAGGLMSYGTSITDAHYQAGVYAGRILKGAKPADLPIVQPTKFEFVINLKTARTFGLKVPDKLLALADEVIE
jgi:putative tryptophan/tyrosine transport system substrate-binding protein